MSTATTIDDAKETTTPPHPRKRKKQSSSTRKRSLPITQSLTPTLPSTATRRIIRRFHTLQKQLHTLPLHHPTRPHLQHELDALGGLNTYQLASQTAATTPRGGDTSCVFTHYLLSLHLKSYCRANGVKLRGLDVGAVSIDTFRDTSAWIEMTRIDLHAQHPGIFQADFMHITPEHAPFPCLFDMICLSLVLNFIPEHTTRGSMLRRLALFLRDRIPERPGPWVYIVLPLPCIENSRYMTESRMNEEIMGGLGYTCVYTKTSSKLWYAVYEYLGQENTTNPGQAVVKKKQVNPGVHRNNFCISLT